MTKLYLGADDSRRQECIGSMIICGVLVPESDFEYLNQIGVDDSKKLSKSQIKKLGVLLRDKYVNTVFRISAKEISKSKNINQLETRYFLALVQKYHKQVDKIFIDSVTSNTEKLYEYVGSLINYKDKLVIECKADENYLPVQVASIIAKYNSNVESNYLDKKYGTGSGAPSDPKTLNYILNNLDNQDEIIRTSWVTYTRLRDNPKLREELTKLLNSNKFDTKKLKEVYNGR